MLAVRLNTKRKRVYITTANQKPCSCTSPVTDNSEGYKKDPDW